ncbi:MAG: hypothetical protein ACKV2T_36730 [Kofleriaceae bacterium]
MVAKLPFAALLVLAISTAVAFADTKDTRSAEDRKREIEAVSSMVVDTKVESQRVGAIYRLREAIALRDIARVEADLRLPLKVSGISFDTRPCQQSFGGTTDIDATELPTFVGCVAQLEIESFDQRFRHGPGIEIVAAFDGSLVTELFSTGRISGAWLWRHLISRKPFPVDAQARRLANRDRFVGAIVDICVDEMGTVSSVTRIANTTGAKVWTKRAMDAIWTWKYIPVRSRKTKSTVPVCARDVLAYPTELRWNAAVKLGYDNPGDYFYTRDENSVIDPYTHEVRRLQ